MRAGLLSPDDVAGQHSIPQRRPSGGERGLDHGERVTFSLSFIGTTTAAFIIDCREIARFEQA